MGILTGKAIFGIARWAWALIVLAILALAGWWLVATLTGGKRAETQARLEGKRGDAAIESGADAVDAMGKVADRSAGTKGKVNDAQDRIDDAPDAGAADAAARDGLCDISPDYC